MCQLPQAHRSLLGDKGAAKGENLKSRGLGGADEGQRQVTWGAAVGQFGQEPFRVSGGGARGPWTQIAQVQALLNLLSL